MVHEAYCEEPGEPAFIAHDIDLGQAQRERKNIQEKYEAQGVPFDTDNKSVWKREYDRMHNVSNDKFKSCFE